MVSFERSNAQRNKIISIFDDNPCSICTVFFLSCFGVVSLALYFLRIYNKVGATSQTPFLNVVNSAKENLSKDVINILLHEILFHSLFFHGSCLKNIGLLQRTVISEKRKERLVLSKVETTSFIKFTRYLGLYGMNDLNSVKLNVCSINTKFVPKFST